MSNVERPHLWYALKLGSKVEVKFLSPMQALALNYQGWHFESLRYRRGSQNNCGFLAEPTPVLNTDPPVAITVLILRFRCALGIGASEASKTATLRSRRSYRGRGSRLLRIRKRWMVSG